MVHTDALLRARQRAERAVKDMDDGPLKTKAFEVILSKLLGGPGTKEVSGLELGRLPKQSEQPDTLKGRILTLRAEGFFKTQRTLHDVREQLRSRGWHYPLTTLSGAMQGLARARDLRRDRVRVGKKRVWGYSNP